MQVVREGVKADTPSAAAAGEAKAGGRRQSRALTGFRKSNFPLVFSVHIVASSRWQRLRAPTLCSTANTAYLSADT